MARPRGFAPWEPRDKTLVLVDQVEAVLDEYEKFLPLTVRQIFYRLVGRFGFDKTEQAYERLGNMLVRARRAGLISFAAIRDDGTEGGEPLTYADAPDFWRKVRDDFEHYSRNRLAGQDVTIELWCEAGGMVPQLQRVAYPYSVPVYSTGGFSSLTVTHEIACRALSRDVPTVFIHVGDYDPSGESIFASQAGDAAEFVRQVTWACENGHEGAGDFVAAMGLDPAEDVERLAAAQAELRPWRVALTEGQVRRNELPTAPPKSKDSRSRNWIGETCQLEAMPPELLAEVVRNAIREVIDLGRFQQEVDAEEADKERIDEGLGLAEAA